MNFSASPISNGMKSPQLKRIPIDGKWLAIGIGVGTAIGVATHNLALWISLGVVFGILGPSMAANSKKKDD